jgi:hypothetical protein
LTGDVNKTTSTYVFGQQGSTLLELVTLGLEHLELVSERGDVRSFRLHLAQARLQLCDARLELWHLVGGNGLLPDGGDLAAGQVNQLLNVLGKGEEKQPS